jgi:hypothetical protein
VSETSDSAPSVSRLHLFAPSKSHLRLDMCELAVNTTSIPTLFGYTTPGEFSRARELTQYTLLYVHAILPVLLSSGTSVWIIYHKSSRGELSPAPFGRFLTNVVVQRLLGGNTAIAAHGFPSPLHDNAMVGMSTIGSPKPLPPASRTPAV